MSAPSLTHFDFDSAAHARDAYFSSGDQPAEGFPAAEHEPPVCPVATPPPRPLTRGDFLNQALRLEILLSLWRLEFGCLDGFWDAYPQYAELAPAAQLPEAPPHADPPDPVTDEDYISQVALKLFGNQAA